jgi:Tfp pilus assembly protein PilV
MDPTNNSSRGPNVLLPPDLKDDYYVVKKKQIADEQPLISSTPSGGPSEQKQTLQLNPNALTAIRSAMLTHQMGQKRSRMEHQRNPKNRNKTWNYRPFSCDISERITSTSGSATSNAVVKALLPNNSSLVTEASSFASVFDEARCKGVSLHARVIISGSTTSPFNAAWGVVYDVANATAYTSVTGQLFSGQCFGPVSVNNGNTGTSSVDKTGYLTIPFRTLNPIVPSLTSTIDLAGDGWFATSDQASTGPVVGYLKWFIDAAPTTTILDCFIVYHMEYRERS